MIWGLLWFLFLAFAWFALVIWFRLVCCSVYCGGFGFVLRVVAVGFGLVVCIWCFVVIVVLSGYCVLRCWRSGLVMLFWFVDLRFVFELLLAWL